MGKLNLNNLKGAGTNESSATNGTVASGGGDKPAAGLSFLKTRAKPATVEAAHEPAPLPAEAGKSSGLGFLKSSLAGGSTGSNRPADSKPDADGPKPAGGASGGNGGGKPSPASGVSGGGIDDLASLMDSESGGTPSGSINGRPEFVSRFADEVPAQAPDRELPAELEPSQRSFIDSLDSVYKIMHEPDLLGGVVKNIMMELARNPEYRKLVSPTDVHVMIRGMRDSMGMARIKKEESKSKRAGGSKRTSKRVDDLETLAALDEVFGAGDFN